MTRVKVICDGCGKEVLFKPNVGKLDIVINGAISNSAPCPDCGGKMTSITGSYKFINGKLVEQDC